MTERANLDHLAEAAQRLRVSWRKMNNYTASFATLWFEQKKDFDAGKYPGWTFAFWLGQRVGLPEASITKMLLLHSNALAAEHRAQVEAAHKAQRAEEAATQAADKAERKAKAEAAAEARAKADAIRKAEREAEAKARAERRAEREAARAEREAAKQPKPVVEVVNTTVQAQHPASSEPALRCQHCGKLITDGRRNTRRFCNDTCRAAYNRGAKRPKPSPPDPALTEIITTFKALRAQHKQDIAALLKQGRPAVTKLQHQHKAERQYLIDAAKVLVDAGRAGIDPDTDEPWMWKDWVVVYLGITAKAASHANYADPSEKPAKAASTYRKPNGSAAGLAASANR